MNVKITSYGQQKLKGLFFRGDVYPQVIVSDRDLALMNTISVVFPEATNILCQFHINKNVKAKCKMFVDSKEAWDIVLNAWGGVVDCHKCDAYDEVAKGFEELKNSLLLERSTTVSTFIIKYCYLTHV